MRTSRQQTCAGVSQGCSVMVIDETDDEPDPGSRPVHRRRPRLAWLTGCAALVVVAAFLAESVWGSLAPTGSIRVDSLASGPRPTVPYVETTGNLLPGVVRYAGLSWSPDDVVSFPLIQVDDTSIIGAVGLASFGKSSLVFHRAGDRDVVLATLADQHELTGAAVSADSTAAAWSSNVGRRSRLEAASLPGGRTIATLRSPPSSTARVVGFLDVGRVVIGVRAIGGRHSTDRVYVWTLATNTFSELHLGSTDAADSMIGDVNAKADTILIYGLSAATGCTDAYTISTAAHRWRACAKTNLAPPVRINDAGTLVAAFTTIDATSAVQVMRVSDGRVLDRRKLVLPAGAYLVSQPIWESDSALLIRYTGKPDTTIRCTADLESCRVVLGSGTALVDLFGSQPGQSMLYPER
jgi:hypothetical protein